MVYLIHFDKKLAHAQHYIGFAEDQRTFETRIKQHRSKAKKTKGAKLLRAVNIAGIGWDVVKVWEDGDRTFERSLKNKKKTSCICPVCTNKNKKVA